ncbi:MAG: PetM family of cytochrome b6f complex subunit 7 [Microvirga sp.]
MKFLARSLGLLLVAAGFVGLVIDGTRSMVNQAVSFVTIEGATGTLFPGIVTGLERQFTGHTYSWLWDPYVIQFLQLPASVTGFLIGALLLWLGQKSMEPIGYVFDR